MSLPTQQKAKLRTTEIDTAENLSETGSSRTQRLMKTVTQLIDWTAIFQHLVAWMEISVF